MSKLPQLLMLFIALLPLSTPVGATEWGKTELMALLATANNSEQLFTEKKELAFLDIPVVTEGTLSYSPPNRMVKQVNRPNPSRYEIDGNTITISRPGTESQVIDMESHPQLRLFIETLKAVLSGDIASLEKHYTTVLVGTRKQWELQLTPIDNLLANMIERLTISGQNQTIKQMVTQERSGDHTTLTFHGNG